MYSHDISGHSWLETIPEGYQADPKLYCTLEAITRLHEKLYTFWSFVVSLSALSRCKRLKVGTIIVPPDLTEVLAIGYNGPPSGRPNDTCRSDPGACGCVHGEANALLKLRTTATGLIMMISDTPCEHCAGLILNSVARGIIAGIIYGREYRDSTGLNLLSNAHVHTKRGNAFLPVVSIHEILSARIPVPKSTDPGPDPIVPPNRDEASAPTTEAKASTHDESSQDKSSQDPNEPPPT